MPLNTVSKRMRPNTAKLSSNAFERRHISRGEASSSYLFNCQNTTVDRTDYQLNGNLGNQSSNAKRTTIANIDEMLISSVNAGPEN